MSSRQMPTDPVLRLELGLRWIKKEWKLAAGLLIAALVSVSLALSGESDPSSPWNPRETQTMSGLPLAPAQSGISDQAGPSREDLEEFAKLQHELSKMPQPDLLDRKGRG